MNIFKRYCCVCLLSLMITSCVAQKKPMAEPTSNAAIAFPGAEGFGKYTTGGRGGKVWIVTNLNNDGPGSFREAVEAKGKRIIVFEISGTIHLTTKLLIKGDVTIAGQTAPGDGICLADQSVSLGGDNIIVRYLRFRMGDKYQKGGMVDGNGGDDAFGGTKRKNIIIDHCSISWSTDEVFSVYNGDSTTLQWNLIGEPLNYSYHFETGDKDYEHHGYGGIWGGQHLSAHHNLFAHCNNRNPRFNGIRQGLTELVDYSNNVIYNWGSNTIYAGEGGNYNIINNYFKSGPSTLASVKYRIVNPGRTETIPFGLWYVEGNVVEGANEISATNEKGVIMGNAGTAEDKLKTLVTQQHQVVAIPLQKAREAYQQVLAGVGASFKRDTLDQRIILDVKNGTGKFIDVQGGYPHGTEYEKTVNAWPSLISLPALIDSDRDGMPDEWEIKNGLDPKNANDANGFLLNPQFSNIEMYFNGLLQ